MSTPTPPPTKLSILGTRGIPARHGGFETFAEDYALHLARAGWDVSVYCQTIGSGPIREEHWQGVRRILVPAKDESAKSSLVFDFRCILHARKHAGICLTLGYNTAIFNAILRLSGKSTLMNMDGIEWSRAKWSLPTRIWLWANEFLGAKFSDHLIADHPEISRHLQRHTSASKITTIPYGAAAPSPPPASAHSELGLTSGNYALLVARPEPENSILEIVRAWNSEPRGMQLLVLGNYHEECPYHLEVLAQASAEVKFPGAIYEKERLQALRWHAALYVHGHQVGGTNPSLVEALACRNPILAHDNRFNRWVAGNAATYFSSEADCASKISVLIRSPKLRQELSQNAQIRHAEAFTLEGVHEAYRTLCLEVGALSTSRR